MADATIKHTGIVTEVTDNHIKTSIIVSSACSGCHAKSACISADTSSRIVTTARNKEQKIEVGDKVNIEGSRSTGLRAVFFAYVLPFILVLATLIISIHGYKISELKAGLYSLLVLPPYYLILYLMKDKFEKKYTFRIIS